MLGIRAPVGESDTQDIVPGKQPSLDGTVAIAANKDSWNEGSCPATPSRSTGVAVIGHIVQDLGRSNPGQGPKDSMTTADLRPFIYDSPLTLTPASVTSVVSDTSGVGNIWDSPQTPCRASNEKLEAYDLTPITPPTLLSMTGKRASDILTPCRLPSTSTIFDKIEASIVHTNDQDARKDSVEEEEKDFEPKKLIRGLTADLMAIAAANIKAAQGQYTLRPTFDFSAKSVQYTPIPAQKDTKQMKPLPKISNNDQISQQSRDAKPQVAIVSGNSLAHINVRTLLEEIIPRDLQGRLDKGPLQCVASLITRPKERCTSMAKAPWNFDEGHLKSLSQYIDRTPLIEAVADFIQTLLCGTHRNSANKRLEKLQRLVLSSANLVDDKLPCLPNSEDATSSREPCHAALQEGNKGSGAKGTPQAENGSSTARANRVATATFKLTRPVLPSTTSYSLEFRPYQPKKWQSVSTQDALRRIVTKPLTPSDLKEGFIYVFWDVKHFGMVKIGRTKNLQQRLREWNLNCKRKHKYHTLLPMIPHVGRMERLIHMELKDQRRSRRCEECDKTHKEWFEVSEPQTVKVFQKWEQWIVQKPYALDEKSGKWILRPDMMASLSQLCEPVLLPPLAQKSQKKRDRRSSRPNSQQK